MLFFQQKPVPEYLNKDFKKFVNKLLGFTPTNYQFYFQAFLHSSYANSKEHLAFRHNERLEFLGDLILDAIVGEFLFEKFPDYDEGNLTRLKTRFVSRKTLNQLADKLDLVKFVAGDFRKGEIPEDVKGNTFEALVGAIFLDKGYKKTKKIVITRFFDKHLNLLAILSKDDDFKSKLIKWCQKGKRSIRFEAEDVMDTKNNRAYRVTVWIADEPAGAGVSLNKKSAEQLASKEACEKFYI